MPTPLDALRFAASLRGATTHEDTILWGLQREFLVEADNGTYAFTPKGKEYIEQITRDTKSVGGSPWLPPMVAVAAGLFALRWIVRRFS